MTAKVFCKPGWPLTDVYAISGTSVHHAVLMREDGSVHHDVSGPLTCSPEDAESRLLSAGFSVADARLSARVSALIPSEA